MSPRLTRTLEFVEDAELLLDALESMRSKVVTVQLLKTRMEEIRRRTYDIRTVESYLRFAKDFQLIVELSERHGYRLTELGLHVVDLKSKGVHNKEFKYALARVLLSSPRKGHIFSRFLEYAREAPTKQMIWKVFNPPTGKVLIRWCLTAGLVREHEGYVATVPPQQGKERTDTEFWRVLSETFAQMSTRSMPGMKRLYAKIREIRPKVTVKLGFDDNSEFDSRLERLLSDKRYRSKISLYGAPTHELEENQNVFVHGGKRYAYIAVRRGST